MATEVKGPRHGRMSQMEAVGRVALSLGLNARSCPDVFITCHSRLSARPSTDKRMAAHTGNWVITSLGCVQQ